MVVLGRPRPPTFLNFKEKYVEGDQRFGTRRAGRTMPLSKEQQGGVEMQKVSNGNSRGHGGGGGGSEVNAGVNGITDGPAFMGPTALRDFAKQGANR